MRGRGEVSSTAIIPANASRTASSRISRRFPLKRNRTLCTFLPRATPTYTSPTGFCRVPPPGPATPDTLIAQSQPNRACAPVAMATTVFALTAPLVSRIAAGTPSIFVFTSFAYAMTPPRNQDEAPGIEVSAAPTNPPVHDSATQSVRPRSARRRPRVRASWRDEVVMPVPRAVTNPPRPGPRDARALDA